MFIESLIIYLALGAFTGFMAGLLGVGGGGILVPLLATFFAYQGWPSEHVMHMALGTAMASMIVSSLSSTRAHATRGMVIWPVMKGMAPGIIIGAFITTHFASHVSSYHVAVFFSLFMALISIQMFINWSPPPSEKPLTLINMMSAGGGIGSVSALAAVGGGFLTVAYLTFKNIEMKKAVGTSAAIGLPIAIAGTAGYMINGWTIMSNQPWTAGFVYIPAFLAISIASFLFAPFGARLSQSLPNASLRKIFGIVTMVLSAKMLYSIA
jgi:uncharacterized membrane protein YfcA